MNKNNSIQIFITGGTFDKSYNYINGDLYFEKTHIPEMLKRSRCRLDVNVETLMMIDSLEMDQSHIDNIILKCKKCESSKIVITHGTDRIVSTAETLAAANIEGKTIVLTGAMVPYAFGTSSDGFFNLGSALAFVQVLNPGVYVAMNGRYYNWDEVKKNRKTGYFEEK